MKQTLSGWERGSGGDERQVRLGDESPPVRLVRSGKEYFIMDGRTDG